MGKFKINCIIVIFSILFNYSCSSTQNDSHENNIYKISAFDNKMVYDYNIISLIDNKNNKIVLLSRRIGVGVDKPPFSNFERMQIGKSYKIPLEKNKDIIKLERIEKYPFEIEYTVFDSILLLHHDSIVTTVYTSKRVFDMFVEIKK